MTKPRVLKPKALTLAPDPQLTALKSRATKLLKGWANVEVTSTAGFEGAGEALKTAVQIRKDLKALPVYVELARQKADIKAKEKLLKDVDKTIETAEDAIRTALSTYAAAQRKAQEEQVSKALTAGKDEKAAALAAKPFIPAVEGLSFTEHWHAEVTDKLAVIKLVAAGHLSPDALEPNMVWLNARARDFKAEDLGIEGVKGVKETSSSVRT